MNMLVLLVALVICLGCGWAGAKVYISQPQAIQMAFPRTAVERKTAFLTPDQVRQIESLAQTKPDSSIVTYYVARSSTGVEGIAFFDRRLVRTLPVVYMAVVKPSGAIDRVEILSFDEPEDYLPPAPWLKLYRDRVLNNNLTLGRGIPHITGASLTSQAMNDGIRLILATYQVAVKGAL
jgi:electron transport complex protein RnfG